MIVVSFNGEFTYDPLYNRWNHVNGSMFSLFVRKNIRLNALLDKLHVRLGIDRSVSKLGVKALFTYASVGNISPDDILDDETLNGYIEVASDSKNVIFCVNVTPVEANNEPIFEDDGIDLNQDCNAPDDNNNSDYSLGNFPSPVQELATDPNFNPFEQQYGCSGFENHVPTQRLGEASDQQFQCEPVRQSHNLSNQPSSSHVRVEMVGEYTAPFEFGPPSYNVINSQSHNPFQYPPNQPSSSRAQPIQQPYNLFGGSVTSFLTSPFAPHIQTDQTGRDDNNNQGANARASVREDYSWRIPTFEDDLPRCLSTGTLHMNDVNELFIGKQYDSKEDFNLKIKSYAVANNFQMRLGRSDTRCLYYTCLNDTCKWHVRAKRVKTNTTHTFDITTLNDVHTCASQNADNDNRQATPIVIASLLSQKMEELGNEYKPRHIMEDMLTTYSVQLTYDQAYRAHEMMRMLVRGSPTECYNAIPSYLWMVREANEGTYVDFQLDNLGRFGSCFMALGPSRRGFKYCRPILCVDATHLKTRFSGQLFVDVAVDAGDHLFPVAFGIAEKECNDSWGYFMRQLRVAIEEN